MSWREVHLQQYSGQFARPFAEICGCQRYCFQTRRRCSRSGCSPQCRCRMIWGCWGSTPDPWSCRYWVRGGSLSVGHYELCCDDIGDLPGSPNHLWLKEKMPMKFASGFCIPEALPVHTGVKGLQVHPLIRFLLRSPVDEKCADLHKPFIGAALLGCFRHRSTGPRAVTAMLAWAAMSIRLEVNRPPSPKPSQLDEWFLGAGRNSQLRSVPVPFFPEVHEELIKLWMAPFTARSRSSVSSVLTTLDGGPVL